MICEFLDVFLEDLPNFHLDWKIEFSIDLIPHAKSITKTSYHLALIELQEMKTQL